MNIFYCLALCFKWLQILLGYKNVWPTWLAGCFGLNGPLRQYFSLYRDVSQREGERGERIDESKNVQTTPTGTYCKCNRPLPYWDQNCRTPLHSKFTQHHRLDEDKKREYDSSWLTVDISQCIILFFYENDTVEVNSSYHDDRLEKKNTHILHIELGAWLAAPEIWIL